MPEVTQAFDDQQVIADSVIVEMRIWRLPRPVAGSGHGLKYSLFYGYQGKRLVACDNESGKVDHRHLEDEESSYRFTTIEKLIEDFLADVRRARSRT